MAAMKSRVSLEELQEKIELFLCEHAHPVLTEPGREVMDLAFSSYSLSRQHDKLLWHIWNDQANRVRPITGLHKESPERLELRFQRFGKGPPGTLVLADSRAQPEQLGRRTRRQQYAQALRRWVHQLFPQSRVLELTSEPDWAHSLSGRYARGVLALGPQTWAILGTGEEEDVSAADGILTYGLLWLDWLRQQQSSRVISGLKLFVPSGRADLTVQRLGWIDPKLARCELYETGAEVLRRNLKDVGNLRTTLSPAPKLTAGPPARGNLAERIVALQPEIRIRADWNGHRTWSMQGVVFARETARGIVFGLGRAETPLTEENFAELDLLAKRIAAQRRPDALDRTHPLYRIYPERWMEALVSQEPTLLGFDLLPCPVYEQVPSLAGHERGLIDLLAVNRQGRLVVIELKASEEIHLPLQALDYWIRVHWHQQRGELTQRGYFPGQALSADPPLLLLVSPALQFHPACETILRYLSPAIEAVRVGLNENWREQLQVLFRAGRGQAVPTHRPVVAPG